MTDSERVARCDREIAAALLAAQDEQPTTVAGRVGILLWEMDWRAERELISAETSEGQL